MSNVVKNNAAEHNGITINEAVMFCQLHNLEITKVGLYGAGRKERWIKKINGHTVIFTDGLKEYIKIATAPIPDGWIKLSKMYSYAKNTSHFYHILNLHKDDITIRHYGKGKAKYAKEKDIRQLFENCRRDNIKEKIKKLDIPD